MKKITCLLIASLPIAVGLSACGKKEESPAVPAETGAYTEQAMPAPAPAPVPEPAPEPAPAPAALPPAPMEAESKPVAPEPQRYTVVAGDTLYRIARSHGVSVDDLAGWNNISNRHRLNVGQQLQVSAPVQ